MQIQWSEDFAVLCNWFALRGLSPACFCVAPAKGLWAIVKKPGQWRCAVRAQTACQIVHVAKG